MHRWTGVAGRSFVSAGPDREPAVKFKTLVTPISLAGGGIKKQLEPKFLESKTPESTRCRIEMLGCAQGSPVLAEP